jgi:hypothetical protein
MEDSVKAVHDQCTSIVHRFKRQRETTSLICLYEYGDLDFDYPFLLFAMVDNDENEAIVYKLLGQLTSEQNDLPSTCRKSFRIEFETLVK